MRPGPTAGALALPVPPGRAQEDHTAPARRAGSRHERRFRFRLGRPSFGGAAE